METTSFRKLLRRTLLLPLVLLVLLALTLVVEVLSLASSLHRVDHTSQVLDASRQSMRYMLEMESALRGYTETRDPSFLQTFDKSKQQLPGSLDSLAQLVADNPRQQERLKDIREVETKWIEWAQQELAKHATTPATSNELLYETQLMDQVRERQRALVAEEQRLLNERSRKAETLGRVIVISAISLSGLVVTVLLTLTRRELRKLTANYELHLQAEQERTRQLQESREFLRITLNSLAEGVLATDASGNVTFINPVAQKLAGWNNADQVLGYPIWHAIQVFDEQSRAPLPSGIEDLLRPDNQAYFSDRLLMVDRGGREFPVEVNAAPILNEHRKLVGWVIVFRDITQRRQTEQTLRASERLTQAGRLSATIAHEIRNPLDTVTNLIYLLQHDSNSGEATEQYLQMASEELSRITQITGQLLTFHREARHPVEVSIPEVLNSVLTLFAPQVRNCGITVEKRYATEAKVCGFPGELRQVFSNLVANALDAMPSGGRLILSVREGSRRDDPSRKGIRITIIDSGSGIPLGVKRNLFAPFYTTKGEKGTGLGLWVSRGIVDKHEGTIHVISSTRERRSGTAFSVFLPFKQVEGKLDAARFAPAVHT